MISAAANVSTVRSIAEKYGVSTGTVGGWARETSFPEVSGTPRKRLWPTESVDAWVKTFRGSVWHAANPGSTTQGDPQDLLDAEDFAAARGGRLGKKPVTARTMSGYIAHGQIPKPDRYPDDGRMPPVARYSWFRATVDTHLTGLTGSGNRSGMPRRRSAVRQEQAGEQAPGQG